MSEFQIILFVIKMIIEYGPKLWKLGKGIYDDIEARSVKEQATVRTGAILSSEDKAKEFNRKAEIAISRQKGYVPKRQAVNQFREDIWKYRNPNATPKELSDAKLRAGW